MPVTYLIIEKFDQFLYSAIINLQLNRNLSRVRIERWLLIRRQPSKYDNLEKVLNQLTERKR